MKPQEILPGLHHWTAVHPKISIEVSSYSLAGRVLLDPLLPPVAAGGSKRAATEEGLAWLREHGPPDHVILTNRHHWRHASEIVGAFGCAVWCNELGLHELEGRENDETVRGFRAGDELLDEPVRIETYEVGVLCPDETALRVVLPGGEACLAVADGVVRLGEDGGGVGGDGPLCFVPDHLIADTPDQAAEVKRVLKDAYWRLLDLEWETLLLAHGQPVVGDGKAALRAFCEA